MQKIDEEALAEAYNRALALEKSGDVEAAVKAYHEVLAIDPDDHGGAAVRIASMGRGETPDKAPDAYVATLFDQHADVFEDVLVEQLDYHVPMLVRQRLQALKLGPFARVLDLGCGTRPDRRRAARHGRRYHRYRPVGKHGRDRPRKGRL